MEHFTFKKNWNEAITFLDCFILYLFCPPPDTQAKRAPQNVARVASVLRHFITLGDRLCDSTAQCSGGETNQIHLLDEVWQGDVVYATLHRQYSK